MIDAKARQEERLRIINKLQRVSIHSSPRRDLAALVRVRGLDLRAGDRGVVFGSRQPTAILVREPNRVRRVALEPPRDVPRTLAFVGAPLLAMAAVRLIAPKDKQ